VFVEDAIKNYLLTYLLTYLEPPRQAAGEVVRTVSWSAKFPGWRGSGRKTSTRRRPVAVWRRRRSTGWGAESARRQRRTSGTIATATLSLGAPRTTAPSSKQFRRTVGRVDCCTESTSSVAAGFGRHGMPPPASNPDLWPFDLETGVRVASKVRNLPSKSGHARPLSSGIIRYMYATDGQTDRVDGRTDRRKQRLLPPSLRSGHNKQCRFQSSSSLLHDTIPCITDWRGWQCLPDKRSLSTNLRC